MPPTDATRSVALLGPTNTGKTHRAVERMLEFPSGMIGLPLRLLAREIYDRVTARVGEDRVALVTGEEKRVPKRAAYWICTTEAMPLTREVDFLAVDEVQLATHDERGHVFTDRLLHARGRQESWFLGSHTMSEMVARLVPAARQERHPRLSRLTFAGKSSLGRLPPRTAVIAFSLPELYAIAGRLKALRGGVAVVLGALSPRTRNAQVGMFQAGEVDYLVATDAIGMGLNLDLNHVAFASLRKFDGRASRALDPAELAQIAGRAGRYLRDGTFGTLSPLELPSDVTALIEQHRFEPIRRVRYRNSELDFTS
ncbi:MAG TPA: helicase-related protein, partial [Polyangiaceae bacterium]